MYKSTLTEALLDRIVHNRIDIVMSTDNFRIKYGNYLANHYYHDWLLFW